MKYIIEVPDDMEYALLTGGVRGGYYSLEIEFAKLEKAQSGPRWIPVTEKLPGIGEPVLDESLSVNWMSYKSGGKEWVFPRDVKAWMPLPGEPYKGVTE